MGLSINKEHKLERWERRDKKVNKRKQTMPKHGKGLGETYRNVVEKANKPKRGCIEE